MGNLATFVLIPRYQKNFSGLENKTEYKCHKNFHYMVPENLSKYNSVINGRSARKRVIDKKVIDTIVIVV